MAIFDNNKFRPEEQLGGFKAGIEDQDLFYLNSIDEYPGILPDFEFEEKSISQLLSEREGIPFENTIKKIVISDGNKVEPVIDLSPVDDGNSVFGEFGELGESFIKKNKENLDNDLEPLAVYNSSYHEDDSEINFGSPIRNNVENKNTNNFNNDVSNYNPNNYDNLNNPLDSDLNSLIEEGLALSKERKKNNSNVEPLEKFSEFDNVGENAFGELNPEDFNVAYDFDDIKASSPSKMGITNLENEKVADEVISGEDEKKKKKKPLALWKVIAITAAATLVLISIIGLVLMKILDKTKNDKTELVQNDKKAKLSNKTNKKSAEKHESANHGNEAHKNEEYDTSHSRKSELVAENDDVKVELKVEVKPENKDSQKDSQKENGHSQTKVADNSHNNSNHKNESHTNFEGKITFKEKPNEHLAINSKDKEPVKKITSNGKEAEKHSDNHNNKQNDKHTSKNNNQLLEHVSEHKSENNNEKQIKKEIVLPAVSFNKNVNSKNKLNKTIENETFFEQPKTDNKNNKKENLIVSNNEKPKEQSKNQNEFQNEAVEEIYSVQVYSSLSKSDALDMIEKMKKMGISNAFITKQYLRDEIWYRVRFGNFGSKDEAKTTASKYGFSQIWIDRIK
ncbi:MAG: SPOR domain-containing protein [Candidatus Kapaibacteriota bacterium]